MEIENLSVEEKEQLLKKLEEDKKKAREKLREDRLEFKDKVSERVGELIDYVTDASAYLSIIKSKVFNSVDELVVKRNELYDSKKKQQSYSFTDDKGNTITIGYNILERFDDTVNVGIEKVQEFIASLATNEETAKLITVINSLLKKDAKGNLKANRVLDLENMVEQMDNELFTEGVKIIREAYKPARSSCFIKASVKNEIGGEKEIPLSISSVGFDPKTEVKISF